MCIVFLAEYVWGFDVRGLLPPIPARPDRTLPGQPGAGGHDDHQGQENSLLQHPEGARGQREVRNGRWKDEGSSFGVCYKSCADLRARVGQRKFWVFYRKLCSLTPQVLERLGGPHIRGPGLPGHLWHYPLSRPAQVPRLHRLRSQPDLPRKDLHYTHVRSSSLNQLLSWNLVADVKQRHDGTKILSSFFFFKLCSLVSDFKDESLLHENGNDTASVHAIDWWTCADLTVCNCVCVCRKNNVQFAAVITRLQELPQCQRLPFMSFLLLPFQRITRIKMLTEVYTITKRQCFKRFSDINVKETTTWSYRFFVFWG